MVNQVELNPYFPQKGLLEFCHRNQIHVTAYGPLGCTPVPVLIGRPGPGPLEDKTVSKPPRPTGHIPFSYNISRLLDQQHRQKVFAYSRTGDPLPSHPSWSLGHPEIEQSSSNRGKFRLFVRDGQGRL